MSETIPVETLRVELGERSYDILVGPGLIERAGAEIRPLLRRHQAVVVTDETVARLHLPTLLRGLETTGVTTNQIVVPQGEASKSLASWQSVVDQLLAFRETVGDFGTLLYAGHDWADPQLARRSMELMAEKVMPAVNAALGGTARAA